MTVKRDGTTVMTRGGKVRFSYAWVINPKREVDENTGKISEKYQVSVLIPKEETEILDAIQAAVDEAKEYGKSAKWGGKIPGTLKLPVRDGDEKDSDEYAGMMFVNANKQVKEDRNGNPIYEPPTCINAFKEAITSEDVFYSGCYGNVSLTFFAYASKDGKSKGVGCALNGVQKIKDGERLSGGRDAFNDFDEEEDTSESFDFDA